MQDNSQTTLKEKLVNVSLGEQVVGRPISDLAMEALEEIERLEKLLQSRDDYIVNKGLWINFTESLK